VDEEYDQYGHDPVAARFFGRVFGRPTFFALGVGAGVVLGLALAAHGISFGPLKIAPAGTSASAPGPTAPVSDAASTALPQTQTLAAAHPTLAPVAPQPMPLPGEARPLTVGVFGDSLGDGLYAGLYHQVRDGKTFEVVKFSQVSTGLTRYDYVDVYAKTERQLAQRHVDVAVVMFGANDQQGIVDGKKVIPFGAPDWRAAYGERAGALVNLLRKQGAVVYWVGLPKMQRAGYDHGAAEVNSVLAQKMAELGVPFFDTVPLTADEHGGYAAYLGGGAGKRPTLMRANDGIHMSMAGYLRIAEPVSGRLRADLAAALARQKAAGEAQTASAASAPAGGASP
jgi:uncharacterized protein